MQRTSMELALRWFEEIWAQGGGRSNHHRPEATYTISKGGASVPLNWEEYQRAHHSLKEGLSDIRMDIDGFASDGDRVSCAMVVKARNKFSGAPIAFRSTFDGSIRDGRLISASNVIDYLPAE